VLDLPQGFTKPPNFRYKRKFGSLPSFLSSRPGQFTVDGEGSQARVAITIGAVFDVPAPVESQAVSDSVNPEAAEGGREGGEGCLGGGAALRGNHSAGDDQSELPPLVDHTSSSSPPPPPSPLPLLLLPPPPEPALEGLGEGEAVVGQWFDFNDSWIKPVGVDALEQQFEGGESAYMLFYRKRDATLPEGGTGGEGERVEKQHGVPEHLEDEIHKYSIKVKKPITP